MAGTTLPITDNQTSAPGWFRLVMIIGLELLCTESLLAQKKHDSRESARFWVSKGQELMQASQYAEAYTAFQLARSLGATNMTALMELSKKRNLNSIQFRALLTEARLLAATDPTQSLRLLEYAHSKFPDSTSLIKVIGEVANQPDNWYYSLRADSIQASPKFSYLLADTDKTRLYYRQGDSLMLIHTFSERPTIRLFSPDDRYLFVTTSNAQRSNVYALKGPKMSLSGTFSEKVLGARFSPMSSPGYGSWLLIETSNSQLKLQNLQPFAKPSFIVSASLTKETHFRFSTPFAQEINECRFSPSGRYLFSPAGLWQLTTNKAQLVKAVGEDVPGEYGTAYYRFSGDERQLLFTKNWAMTEGSISLWLFHYTFSDQGDSLRYRDVRQAHYFLPRYKGRPFSPNGHYMAVNDSLFYFDQTHWQPLLPVVKPGQTQSPELTPKDSWLFRLRSRFSPGSTHILLEATDTDNRTVIQLWRSDGPQRYLIHAFKEKDSFANDVFSPDGKYLLSRHTTTDCLWRIEADTVVLVHTFKKSLRIPETFDEDGFPVESLHFSPDSRYLIAYSGTAEEADYLWQINGEGQGHSWHGSLVPIHGFDSRLIESRTVFSPDARFLLVEGSGLQSATLWPLEEQMPLQVKWSSIPPKQALFSPKGNYLITDIPGMAWNVTNRRLGLFSHPYSFSSLNNSRFSPNEQYLMHVEREDSRGYKASLYSLHPNQLLQVRHYLAADFLYVVPSGDYTPQIDTYQSGLFSPDGIQWLQSQAVRSLDYQNVDPKPDTLWNLTKTGLSLSLPLNTHIDRFTVNNYGGDKNWHSIPAAIFSPDGKFLLTKERNKLKFYQLKPTPTPGIVLAGQRGWPIDISTNSIYWLTGWSNWVYDYEVQDDSQPMIDNGIPDTPDTIRLWRRTEPNHRLGWRQLVSIGGLYMGLNRHWQGNQRQRWFSQDGNYLLLPTTKPNLTTLYTIVKDNLRPVLSLNAQLLAAAYLPSSLQNGWDIGLLYTNINKQSYLLQYGSAGARMLRLGFGILERPPRFQGKLAYWVRKIDDSQQRLELLDLVSGQTLVQIPFGAVLDFTVRPNGDAWVVSTVGARLIRSPESTLRWLKQAPVAPLQPGLRQTYVFL